MKLQLLDVELNGCGHGAYGIDGLALILALVVRCHARNAEGARGEHHMPPIIWQRASCQVKGRFFIDVKLTFHFCPSMK